MKKLLLIAGLFIMNQSYSMEKAKTPWWCIMGEKNDSQSNETEKNPFKSPAEAKSPKAKYVEDEIVALCFCKESKQFAAGSKK